MWSKIVVILFFIWVSLNLTSTSVGKFLLKLLSVLVIKITLTLICSQCVCDLSIQTICEKHLPIRPVIYLVFSKCILIYTWTFFSDQLTSKYQVGSPRRLWIIKKILCLFSLIAYCLCKNKNVYFFIIFLFFFFAEWQDTLLHRMRSVSICSYKKQILTRIMCQGKFVPHEWTLNSISPHHRLIARTEYFMWQAFYIVFSAGFWFENSFFLIDDRGYRPGMLNCKEILSPYLLKFWLSVVICTYKYMYNIVIGFFLSKSWNLGESHQWFRTRFYLWLISQVRIFVE